MILDPARDAEPRPEAQGSPGNGAPPRLWRAVGLALRAIQVRLRFIVILVVAFLAAGQWDSLRNHWDRFTRRMMGARSHARAVSPDTEYFCPMDPGVVSEWPGQCGICHMALVRRKRGDTAPLPSGIVARMQFSPYRVQLAGIRTVPITYEPMARAVVLVGTATTGASPHVVEADLFERDRALVAEGQVVEMTSVEATGGGSLTGKVRGLVAGGAPFRSRAILDVVDPGTGSVLRPGMKVIVRVRRPVAELEPFRSMPANPPPIRKGEKRAVYLCPEHPEVVREERGKCPADRSHDLERHPLLDNQRVAWWCPMHPEIAAERPGLECRACGGMRLVPRIVTYRPPGKVLSVPESAVVATGSRTVVYVERMPGMFDGVEVVLGPRCGDAYPVITGLEPGQLVAISGAFLIDAEARLNPSLAAGYFGSSRGDRPEHPQRASSTPASRLPSEHQTFLAKPRVCPVSGKPLGSMGPPVQIEVAGRAVLVCCDACAEPLKQAPEKYLSPSPSP
jgi:hypothetical protein